MPLPNAWSEFDREVTDQMRARNLDDDISQELIAAATALFDDRATLRGAALDAEQTAALDRMIARTWTTLLEAADTYMRARHHASTERGARA